MLLFLSTVNFPYLYLLAPIINRMARFSWNALFSKLFVRLQYSSFSSYCMHCCRKELLHACPCATHESSDFRFFLFFCAQIQPKPRNRSPAPLCSSTGSTFVGKFLNVFFAGTYLSGFFYNQPTSSVIAPL